VIAAAWLAAAASPVLAEPLWEAGAGAAALSLPDYRGSNERHGYVLPFPYVVYRGDRLRIDRNGMFASLFDSERVELDLSFTGNFALRSDGTQARAGMPALHPVLEGGPELVVHLIGRPHRREPRLDLRLAARAAIAVGGGRVTNAGFTGAPYLRLDLPDGLGSGFDVTATLGLLYGDRRHHGYLYSVEPQYATATRPAYDAPGGYAGVQSQISAGRRFGRLWVGGYLRLDSLRGASALEASPLVRSRQYTAAGLAVAWVIGASSQSGASGD
jgi:outer membrane scaffolding protein for murein synthesis (MipA/OmpV family)